jgi:hypothetical protein
LHLKRVHHHDMPPSVPVDKKLKLVVDETVE